MAVREHVAELLDCIFLFCLHCLLLSSTQPIAHHQTIVISWTVDALRKLNAFFICDRQVENLEEEKKFGLLIASCQLTKH